MTTKRTTKKTTEPVEVEEQILEVETETTEELIDTPVNEEIIEQVSGKVILVSSDYIVVEINGNNTHIHKSKLKLNKNPIKGDNITIST